ncbi:AMP-binding protein [Pseudomonas sp. MYb185]|uniref:AMP-binding protein n=1 Tax=Pseudomonas sp. MYb185 TaxID=1848729 RepID=UPI000CFE2152|nr:AMP-binding protein [Pseudomonas sp. MYb185]PRB84101.1 cyclohexanecarboxylate-CoA ligase [Pseudomonas sp. MYb185]
MNRDISGWNIELSQQRLEQGQASGEWLNRTIAEMAAEIAAHDPQRITHVFEGQSCTVSELLQEARLLAGALQRRGLAAGDAISFQLPNWRESAVIDLAASLLGLVIVPIVPIYRDAEVSFMLADARVKAAFFPQQYRGFDFAAMMQRLQGELPQLHLLCCVRGEQSQALDYAALVAEAEPAVSLPVVDANGVKLVLYTSGTTGRPKAVLHSHNTGPLRLKRGFEHWTRGQGGTLLMASPVTHVTGLSGLELPFYLPSRTVFMDRWDAREALEIIDREQVSVSLGATPFLHELLTQAEQHGRRLPSLQAFACGGAEVPPALIYRAAEVFERCRAFRVFGSSEVPLVTLGFVGEEQLELAATTDGEVHGYQVKVVDDAGHEVPAGAEGELMIKGAAMFLGYADAQQNAGSFDAEGYFATGDLGRLTRDNAIVITGRKKDLINRGGEKISAKEVEDILHQLPQVHEAAVVSMPHMRLGETLCAYVILRDGQQLSLVQMVEMVSDSGVARQKIPEQLVVLDDFPRTASGKVRKDQLRADIRARLEQQTAVAQ